MDNTPAIEPGSPAAEEAVSSQVPIWRSPLWWTLIALAVLLLGQWFYTGTQIDALREDFAKRLAGNDALLRQSASLSKRNHELATALQARVASLEADFATAQSQQLALESMYQELSRTRDDRLLAEVEQSITIAAQQLQLAGNVEAALIALNGAEARLAKAAQPQFLPLRKLIARDIAKLTALPVADISGIALKIESIAAQVDAFPMAFEQRPTTQKPQASKPANASAEPAWWQALSNDLWSEMRQLVRIERVDQADPGLLPPDQSWFLRENLKLRLVSARLALLARDSESFREDNRQAAQWLARYFDTRAHAVQLALATVRNFSAFDIDQQAPSINETLLAVRNLKLGRK